MTYSQPSEMEFDTFVKMIRSLWSGRIGDEEVRVVSRWDKWMCRLDSGAIVHALRECRASNPNATRPDWLMVHRLLRDKGHAGAPSRAEVEKRERMDEEARLALDRIATVERRHRVAELPETEYAALRQQALGEVAPFLRESLERRQAQMDLVICNLLDRGE